jgi:hypothetical protein
MGQSSDTDREPEDGGEGSAAEQGGTREATRERPDPGGGEVCRRLVRVIGRPATRHTAGRAHSDEREDEEEDGADDPEFIQNLVVRLLWDEALPGREVRVRLVWEASPCVVEEVHVLLRRELAVPAGAQDGVVEEDAAADVRVDQPLVPAGHVLERIFAALAEAERAEEGAQVARAKGENADRDGEGAGRRIDQPARGRGAAGGGCGDDRGHREVKAEQPGERGAEHDPDRARHAGDERQAPEAVRRRVEGGEAEHEHHRRERCQVMLAEERGLPMRRVRGVHEGRVEESEEPVADGDDRVGRDDAEEQPELHSAAHEEHEPEREDAVLQQLRRRHHRLGAVQR